MASHSGRRAGDGPGPASAPDDAADVGEVADAEPFTPRRRQALFLELTARDGGATPRQVYEHARHLGDTATPEAYYNIARRLAHRASVVRDGDDAAAARYVRTAADDGVWLEEDELADLVDPDYPVQAFVVWREARQQVQDVPEPLWVALRERLAAEDARTLFVEAIASYADDFHATVAQLITPGAGSVELARLRREAEAAHTLLLRLTKYGLGLSFEAVALPPSVDHAVADARDPGRRRAGYVDRAVLAEEIARRVEAGPLVRPAEPGGDVGAGRRRPVVAAVDGSTHSGLLAANGEAGDFQVGHAPLASINTAVGLLAPTAPPGGPGRAGRPARRGPPIIRLPERPEDMQRRDNRYTVMAKLLHPELSDAEYMHSVWNAMDLVETRATLRLMERWVDEGTGEEMPPADVILRDGAVSPQDRDFTHYKQQDSYGRIVRDLLETAWRLTLACREDGRVVCGVVKQAQLGVFAPVINWFACRVAAAGHPALRAWPLPSMNMAPDQPLVTRLLTAGRRRGAPWVRTCVVLRPFHAVTPFAPRYTRTRPPAARVLADAAHALHEVEAHGDDLGEHTFWHTFQGERDAYVRLLRGAQYGNFFLAAVPRLDGDKVLPRYEVLVPAPTDEDGESPWPGAAEAAARAIEAVRLVGHDVADEHSMFSPHPDFDVLPRLLVRVHDLVKDWGRELLGRVHEYISHQLAAYIRGKRARGLTLRPFTRAELETLHAQLRLERERQAGARRLPP